MEKEHFLDLAKNYTSLSIDEAIAVDELQKAFPYSQVVHCLASRGARDHQLESATVLLALSAVYSTDRAILKDIMTAPRAARVVKAVVNTSDGGVVETIEEEVEVVVIREADGLSGDALVNEIMMDLNRLQDLKRIFENSFEEYRSTHPNDFKGTLEKSDPIQRSAPIQKPAAPIQKRTFSVPKAEPPTPALARPAKVAKPADILIPEPSSESLLSQIESTHKKVLPENKRQQEQLQIIDQFITKQPSIPKPSLTPAEAADLTEKSASLTDSMVSETLVEILLRQGKKDKAVEVLRKLIWKFPQKKAIFAAQIEELRK